MGLSARRHVSMKNDDQDFFREAMSDVKPIAKADEKVSLTKSLDRLNYAARRKAALLEEEQEQSGLTGSEEHIEMLSTFDVLEYKRPGIQNGVYRNLRLGKYDIEARLDLHRHT